MIILFLLYTLILELAYLILTPLLFIVFRKKSDRERIGLDYPKQQVDILIHSASVGEVNGIKQLIIELINANPYIKILITTNTKTGKKAAQNIHKSILVALSPLDIFHLREKQLRLSKPKLILIAETEIWPTLSFCAMIHNVPIIYVNARISNRTFKSYVVFKHFFRWAGGSVKSILTQTEADRIRFRALFKAQCSKAGNLKFSVIQPLFDQNSIKREWGYSYSDIIITFGSSRPGEEELILSCYDDLKRIFSNLRLILVPRHLDRMEEINSLLNDRKVSYSSKQENAQDIHIIDEMGLLLSAYSICDIAIIGGSFYPFGGHNALEAAFYQKIIVMGQYYDSCVGTIKKLKQAKAIVISSKDKLLDDLCLILNNMEKYKEYGVRAGRVIDDNQQSLSLHIEEIRKYL